jgi:hypothetical protein
LWSSGILAELDRTLRVLQARRGIAPEETDAYLVRLFRQMETSFPDALVTDWESLLDVVQLPDPADRHVVAAARAGRAHVIVTDNVADFPPGALPTPLIRQSLDEFLLDSLGLYPGQVISAVRAVARRTGRSGPAMTAREHRRLPPGPGHAGLRRTPAGKPRPARPRVSNADRAPTAAQRPADPAVSGTAQASASGVAADGLRCRS